MKRFCLLKKIFALIYIFNIAIMLSATIISTQEKKDFELFTTANNNHGGVISVIDRTLTNAGSLQLCKLLETPTSNLNTLKTRQHVVSSLLKKPELCNSLKKALATIKENEYSLTSLLNQNPETSASSFSGVYYHQKFLKKNFPALIDALNNSPLALNLGHYLPLDLISPIIEIVVFHMAMKYFKEWLNGHSHHHHGHTHTQACDCCPPDVSTARSFFTKIITGLLQVLHFGVHATSLAEGVNHTIDRHDIINIIHNQLYHINKTISAMSTICSLTLQHFPTQLPLPQTTILEELNVFLDNEYIREDTQLDFFAPVGNTLVAHKKLLTNQKEIATLYEHIGTIDAYLSIATLIQEHQNSDNPYCFVNFINQETPYFDVKKAWNPMIAADKVIRNDISLVYEQETKLIITGPNKAGKSSTMKTIGLNALLAQTLGIAAADALTFAPFEKIITYININDDITQDQSMFVAEVIRADNCIKMLQEHKNKPSLVIIDDSLFKSTNYEKGQQLAYDFIKALAEYDHAIILVATHFPLLSTLQEATAGKFSNYHIALTNDTNGNIVSTFTLEPGKETEHDAFTLIEGQHSLTFV